MPQIGFPQGGIGGGQFLNAFDLPNQVGAIGADLPSVGNGRILKGGPYGFRPLEPGKGIGSGPPTALVPSGHTGEKLIATQLLIGLGAAVPPAIPFLAFIGYKVWAPIDAADTGVVAGGLSGANVVRHELGLLTCTTAAEKARFMR